MSAGAVGGGGVSHVGCGSDSGSSAGCHGCRATVGMCQLAYVAGMRGVLEHCWRMHGDLSMRCLWGLGTPPGQAHMELEALTVAQL